MRAKFIYEAFSEEGDPIRDMGIGSPFYKLKRGDLIVLKEGGKGPKGKGLIIDIFISSTIITIKAAFFYTISISEINLVLKNASNYNITTLTFTVSEWEENFRIIKYKDVDNIPMNEKFSQDESDPIQDMEIGQIHIYKKLINTWFNTLYDKTYIRHKEYVINSDLTIDVLQDFDISYNWIKNLPYYIRFNRIHGDFACSFDENEFLDYIPKQVDGELRFYVKEVEDKKHNIIKQKIKQVCIVEEVEVKEAH